MGQLMRPTFSSGGIWVNDIHSQLNRTRVNRVVEVDSPEMIRRTIEEARARRTPIAVSGERHAMGGQQFCADAVMIDTRRMNRVLELDPENGTIEVETGIHWRDLIGSLVAMQEGNEREWGIAQKQTGADHLSIGGALSSNIHGRGLRFKPFIGDVESFTILDARGELRRCSRTENHELFNLAIGGYGLFGVICSAKLRLAPRRKVERVVEVMTADRLMAAFEDRIANGFLYGDFQFAIDERSGEFMHQGIFSCYRPVDDSMSVPSEQKELSEEDWMHLLHLAHTDKTKGFHAYADYYLSTSGQIYWSDTHQLTPYLNDYHHELEKKIEGAERATEIITEIYVPRHRLADFLAEAAEDFRRNDVNLIYGTIRLIERDDESFLAWAKESYACVIFNLHTAHTPSGIEHSASAFRRLIDMAIDRGGSYFLTYHRFATREQVDACYPQFHRFLEAKREHDPHELFQSNWYRHYRMIYTED